jgi:hypothetical protein
MKECESCKSKNSDSAQLCDTCGWDFGKKVIADTIKLQQHTKDLKKARDWMAEVTLKDRVHALQVSRGTLSGRTWSGIMSSKLFGEPRQHFNNDLRLAQALIKYSAFNWQVCKNKNQAIKTMHELELLGIPPVLVLEKELQNLIETSWNTIPLFEEWNLEGSYKKMLSRWEIDLLAHHRSAPKWLVIELKEGLADEEAVGQILRYTRTVRKHLAKELEEVDGLIIAAGATEKFKYSVESALGISFVAYFMEKNRLDFLTPPLAFNTALIKLIRKNGFEGAIEDLENLQQVDS